MNEDILIVSGVKLKTTRDVNYYYEHGGTFSCRWRSSSIGSMQCDGTIIVLRRSSHQDDCSTYFRFLKDDVGCYVNTNTLRDFELKNCRNEIIEFR